MTKFLLSAPDIHHLPKDSGMEVVFIGSSNVGKSSVLNALTQHQNLARTSKTPGRTQFINLFEVEEGIRLVDLPGYGYSAVSKEMKRKWQYMLCEYLEKRECIKGLIVLMDIRHPLKYLDIKILKWSINMKLSVLVLLTKADKFASGKRRKQLIDVRQALNLFNGDLEVEYFSVLKKIGIDKLRIKLDYWYNIPA